MGGTYDLGQLCQYLFEELHKLGVDARVSLLLVTQLLSQVNVTPDVTLVIGDIVDRKDTNVVSIKNIGDGMLVYAPNSWFGDLYNNVVKTLPEGSEKRDRLDEIKAKTSELESLLRGLSDDDQRFGKEIDRRVKSATEEAFSEDFINPEGSRGVIKNGIDMAKKAAELLSEHGEAVLKVLGTLSTLLLKLVS